MVLGKVFAVFHAEGLAGDGGEPRLCETSMAQWRQRKVQAVGGGLHGADAEGARGVEGIGAAGALSVSRRGKAFRGVGDAVAVGVEGRGGRRLLGGCRRDRSDDHQPPNEPTAANAAADLPLASGEFARIAKTMSAQEVIAEFKDLPPAERAQVARFVVENDDSWIPDEFKEAMKDAETGRFVDMETALREIPPPLR